MAFLLQKINLLQPEMLSDDNDYEKVIKIYLKKFITILISDQYVNWWQLNSASV